MVTHGNCACFNSQGIVVYVIGSLKHKYNNGNLGKKNQKRSNFIRQFNTYGMLVGCIIGLIFGMFFPDYSLLAVSLGSGIGYLLGFSPMKFIARQETTSHNPKE